LLFLLLLVNSLGSMDSRGKKTNETSEIFFNISGKKMCEMLQHYLHPCPQVCVDIGKGKIS